MLLIHRSGNNKSKPVHPVFRIVNPSDYQQPKSLIQIDLPAELLYNRERYSAATGDPWLTLFGLPDICASNLDRIRHEAGHGKPRPPGIHPTICVCLATGLEHLTSHPSVESILAAHSRYNTRSSSISGLVCQVMENFLKLRDLDTTIPTKPNQRNSIWIPIEIHKQLTSLKDDLRLSSSTLAIVCIMHVLSQQHECNEDHSQEMTKYVDQFLEGLSIVARGMSALMDTYGI